MTGIQDRTEAALAALEAALPAQRVGFELDIDRLCHPNCPLPLDYLKSRVAYAYLAITVVAGAVGAWLAIESKFLWGSLAVWTAIYWLGLRRLIERKIHKRIVTYIMEDPERLPKLWKYGGVVLTRPDGSRATAPKDDWRSFVLGA